MKTGPARSRLCLAALSLSLGLLSLASGRAHAQSEAIPGVEALPPETPPREDTYETPRSIGMGLGARAGASGTTALALNAANMPLVPVYHVESVFGYLARENAFSAGGAIIDSVTSKIAAGVAFRGVFGGGDRDFSGWDGRLSLGARLADFLALGVSARYLSLTADKKTSDGQAIGDQVKGFTVDASMRFTLTEGLHIAALAYNLVDRGSALTPRRVGGGAAYRYLDVFEVGFDAIVDLSSFDHATVQMGGGVEYIAGGSAPLRAGFQYDTGRKMSSFTAALGYLHPKFGMDLALRQDFGREKATQLLLGLRYIVPQ